MLAARKSLTVQYGLLYNVLMYFKSRAEAGVKLAELLMPKYGTENVVVLALSQAGVAVGYQIAVNLHTALRRLPMRTIHIDDESVDYATVLPGGVVSMSPDLTESEQQYYYSEYSGWLDNEIRTATLEIDRSIGADEISPENMRGYNVILTDDTLANPTKLTAVIDWLKPVRVESLILACPIITVPTLDRAHVLMNDLYILSVVPNYFGADHYYDIDDKPDATMARHMIDSTILGWR